ncbi:MAG: putative selenoprotein [Gammaproteobacteria bacterium]|nr:putative selenoprotein [Gammaproteobacteria bacterium]MBV9621558.1 putative selenoprotein [Gammaproteobacteria bacterium]
MRAGPFIASQALVRAWAWLRTLAGDDAYERYLHHRALRHPGEPTLGRAAFCAAEVRRKWEGVNRCC